MTKIAFLSDIHLDFLHEQQVEKFAQSIVQANPEVVVISGDISTADSIQYDLQKLEQIIQRPIYFVLGNHDYYGSSIELIRKKVTTQAQASTHLKYLSCMSYDMLSPTVAIVGHDMWYDAMCGDPNNSSMNLTDWVAIKEFVGVNAIVNRKKRIELCQKLANEGGQHIYNGIKNAIRYAKHIIVVAHPVPFEETHIYNGSIGSSEAQPWFNSKVLGNLLLDAAKTFPKIQFTCLCGHTHGESFVQKMPNLQIYVAGAVYSKPCINKTLIV